jgi:outer membrane biosynthesis protein TonB
MGNDEIYKGTAQISFVLLRSGNLKEEPREIYSNNNILNKICIRSIKEAAPFPPFPKFMDKPEEAFTITFYSE